MSVTLILFLIYLLIFIIGSIAGSFINTLTCRMAMGLPVLRGKAFCPNCGKPIAFYDRLPLISYIWLGGKCRKCGGAIVPRYFITELIGGVIAVLSVWQFGFNPETPIAFLSAMTLLALGLSAHDSGEISMKIVAVLIIPAILSTFFFLTPLLNERIMGLIVLAVLFFLLSLTPYSDRKNIILMAISGFLLGLKSGLLSVILSVIFAILVIIWRIYRKQGDKPVVFSACLCAGIFTAFYFSACIASLFPWIV